MQLSYVDTAGRNKRAIEAYIKNQLQKDIIADQIRFKEYIDPLRVARKVGVGHFSGGLQKRSDGWSFQRLLRGLPITCLLGWCMLHEILIYSDCKESHLLYRRRLVLMFMRQPYWSSQ